jgi:putative tricarboxylic transport membrane protein
MPMVMGFILGEPLEYAFGQTLAMAQGNFFSFALLERQAMLILLVATPIVAFLLWRRMRAAES